MIRYWCCIFMLFMYSVLLNAQQNRPVSIFGMIKSDSKIDSVELIYHDYILSKSGLTPEPKRFYYLPRKGFYQAHAFKFELPEVARPGYISLKYGKNSVFHHYLIMPGDSVKLFFDLKKNQTVFSGPSAAAFKCQYELQAIDLKHQFDNGSTLVTNNPNSFLDQDNNRNKLKQDTEEFGAFGVVLKLVPNTSEWQRERLLNQFRFPATQDYFKILDGYKQYIEPLRYAILKADIIGKTYSSLIYQFHNRLYSDAYLAKDTLAMMKLDSLYFQYIKPLSDNQVPVEVQAYSAYYTNYLLEKAIAECHAVEKKMSVFHLLKTRYNDDVRDKLVGKFLDYNFRFIRNGEELIKEALEFVKVPEVYTILAKMANNQFKGAKAYNFKLQNEKGEWVKMEDFKGKVVLIDFWFTGCMPCKWFNKNTLQSVKSHFKNRDDFVIVSISVDKRFETWIKSVREGEYTSSDAVNLFTLGQGDDHPLIQHYDIKGYPNIILVDKQGKIARTDSLNTSADKLIPILEQQLAE